MQTGATTRPAREVLDDLIAELVRHDQRRRALWDELIATMGAERKRRGLTQAQIAQRATMDRGRYARIELGEHECEVPSLRKLRVAYASE